MTNKTTITAEPNSHEVIITREFDAPPELVLRAHTEADLMTQWLGPHGSTTNVEKLEARHGGTYRYGGKSPDGAEYYFRGVFHGDPTVDLLVQTFEWEGAPGEISLDLMKLERLDGNRTRLQSTSVFSSIASRDSMIEYGMEQGITEGYERLDELFVGMLATR